MDGTKADNFSARARIIVSPDQLLILQVLIQEEGRKAENVGARAKTNATQAQYRLFLKVLIQEEGHSCVRL